MQVLKALRPNIYVETAEHEQAWKKDMQKLEALGIKMVFCQNPKIDSTSAIIADVIAASSKP